MRTVLIFPLKEVMLHSPPLHGTFIRNMLHYSPRVIKLSTESKRHYQAILLITVLLWKSHLNK